MYKQIDGVAGIASQSHFGWPICGVVTRNRYLVILIDHWCITDNNVDDTFAIIKNERQLDLRLRKLTNLHLSALEFNTQKDVNNSLSFLDVFCWDDGRQFRYSS